MEIKVHTIGKKALGTIRGNSYRTSLSSATLTLVGYIFITSTASYSQDVSIIGSGSATFTAPIQDTSTPPPFVITLTDFGKALPAFNPMLGTLLSSTLTIDTTIGETTSV
jgi:hypothetical protein